MRKKMSDINPIDFLLVGSLLLSIPTWTDCARILTEKNLPNLCTCSNKSVALTDSTDPQSVKIYIKLKNISCWNKDTIETISSNLLENEIYLDNLMIVNQSLLKCLPPKLFHKFLKKINRLEIQKTSLTTLSNAMFDIKSSVSINKIIIANNPHLSSIAENTFQSVLDIEFIDLSGNNLKVVMLKLYKSSMNKKFSIEFRSKLIAKRSNLCVAPENITNGMFVNNTKKVYHSGDRIKFKCNDGYKGKDDDSTMICLETGDWSVTGEVCDKASQKLNFIILAIVAPLTLGIFILIFNVCVRRLHKDMGGNQMQDEEDRSFYDDLEAGGKKSAEKVQKKDKVPKTDNVPKTDRVQNNKSPQRKGGTKSNNNSISNENKKTDRFQEEEIKMIEDKVPQEDDEKSLHQFYDINKKLNKDNEKKRSLQERLKIKNYGAGDINRRLKLETTEKISREENLIYQIPTLE